MSLCILKLNHKQRRKLQRKEKRRKKRIQKYLNEHPNSVENSAEDETEEISEEEVDDSGLPEGSLTNFAIISHFKVIVNENQSINQAKNTKNVVVSVNPVSNQEICRNGEIEIIENPDLEIEENNFEADDGNKKVTSTAENERGALDDEIKDLLSLLDQEVEEWHNPFAPEDDQPQITQSLTEIIDNNPTIPTPHLISTPAKTVHPSKPICSFFSKMGSCRFGDNCSRRHIEPICSDTLLFRNMLQTFAFDFGERNKRQGDTHDINLEYSDNDLYDEFVEFYNDILPEFETIGSVNQLKVCCNRMKHLCGNVYVQYKDQRLAQNCYDKMNGRFYNGKQLSCKFVIIEDWQKAICGLHYRNGDCPRGGECNYLHVFRNPSKSSNYKRHFNSHNGGSRHEYRGRSPSLSKNHYWESRRRLSPRRRRRPSRSRSRSPDVSEYKKEEKRKNIKKKKRHKSRSPSPDGHSPPKHHSKKSGKKKKKDKKKESKKKVKSKSPEDKSYFPE